MATEALAFHLEGMAKDGEPVPEPSSLEEIMSLKENKATSAHAQALHRYSATRARPSNKNAFASFECFELPMPITCASGAVALHMLHCRNNTNVMAFDQ
jgi:hypothetical protein